MIAIAAASIFAASAAQAQMYTEVTASPITITANSGSNTVKATPTVLALTVGYNASPYLAVESMAVTGVQSSKANLNGFSTPASVNIDSAFGVFLKPKYPITENIEIFAKIGYVNTNLTTSGNGVSLSDSSGGVAYGVGANFAVTKSVYATVSYMDLYDKSDGSAKGLNLGVGVMF